MTGDLMNGGNTAFSTVQTVNNGNNFNRPIFFAKATDPLFALACTQYCATALPTAIRAPANAQPAAGRDAHIAIVQLDGTEIDCWQATIIGTSISCRATGIDNILAGSGIESPSATSGNALAAGTIRVDELEAALSEQNGYIPHVLAGIVTCVDGDPIPPFGTSQAAVCKTGVSVPIGTHVQYTPTFSQIDTLAGATDYQKVILRTLHRYGIAVEDTDNLNGDYAAASGFRTKFEDPTPYVVNHQPVPWDAILPSLGFSYRPGAGAWVGPDPGAADPNFAAHLIVVDPCYALRTCKT